MSCYLLQVPRLPSQPVSNGRGWVIDFNWLELPWQYRAMTRNNLSIILISLLIEAFEMFIIWFNHFSNSEINFTDIRYSIVYWIHLWWTIDFILWVVMNEMNHVVKGYEIYYAKTKVGGKTIMFKQKWPIHTKIFTPFTEGLKYFWSIIQV